jgi:preprotein translocase subunit SecE
MNLNSTKTAVKLPVLSYFKEVRSELRQVTWPTRKQVIRLSSLVIIASLATAAYLGSLDYIFIQLLGLLLKR